MGENLKAYSEALKIAIYTLNTYKGHQDECQKASIVLQGLKTYIDESILKGELNKQF